MRNIYNFYDSFPKQIYRGYNSLLQEFSFKDWKDLRSPHPAATFLEMEKLCGEGRWGGISTIKPNFCGVILIIESFCPLFTFLLIYPKLISNFKEAPNQCGIWLVITFHLDPKHGTASCSFICELFKDLELNDIVSHLT